MRIIDNFDEVRKHLAFKPVVVRDPDTGKERELNATFDRYVVQILRRTKDAGGKTGGVNTGNRLVKQYEIPSLEYLDKKRERIVELCRANGARAYILPQVRSISDCISEMLRLCVVNLDDPGVRMQHMVRSAMCGMHKSRDKKWVIDLDNDEMYGWSAEEVAELVRLHLGNIGKKFDECAYTLPTRSGSHIVTSPFNLESASKKCAMLYEGAKKGNELQDLMDELTLTDTRKLAEADWAAHTLHPFNCIEWLGKKFTDGDHLYRMKKALESKKHDITGWLHKDGMTLLYMEAEER